MPHRKCICLLCLGNGRRHTCAAPPSRISVPTAMAAYGMIVRQEGVKALWTGTTPNIARNSVVNAAELATYDQVRGGAVLLAGRQPGSR